MRGEEEEVAIDVRRRRRRSGSGGKNARGGPSTSPASPQPRRPSAARAARPTEEATRELARSGSGGGLRRRRLARVPMERRRKGGRERPSLLLPAGILSRSTHFSVMVMGATGGGWARAAAACVFAWPPGCPLGGRRCEFLGFSREGERERVWSLARGRDAVWLRATRPQEEEGEEEEGARAWEKRSFVL